MGKIGNVSGLGLQCGNELVELAIDLAELVGRIFGGVRKTGVARYVVPPVTGIEVCVHHRLPAIGQLAVSLFDEVTHDDSFA